MDMTSIQQGVIAKHDGTGTVLHKDGIDAGAEWFQGVIITYDGENAPTEYAEFYRKQNFVEVHLTGKPLREIRDGGDMFLLTHDVARELLKALARKYPDVMSLVGAPMISVSVNA